MQRACAVCASEAWHAELKSKPDSGTETEIGTETKTETETETMTVVGNGVGTQMEAGT